MHEARGTCLSATTQFAGRMFTVTSDRVTLPNGRTVTMEVVRHPGSVVLIPMTDTCHVVLIRQYRYALDRWIWELPAGSLEPGENPVAAAARESEEEIGLIPSSIELVGRYYPTPGFCTEEMLFYRLTGLAAPNPDGPLAEQDEDEDLRVQVFTVEQARDLVRQGEVVDLKTVYGFTLL